MTDDEKLRREFDELASRIAESQDAGMVTNWILVLETMRPDGTRILNPYWDTDSMTPWLYRGILQEISDVFETEDPDTDDDEEED